MKYTVFGILIFMLIAGSTPAFALDIKSDASIGVQVTSTDHAQNESSRNESSSAARIHAAVGWALSADVVGSITAIHDTTVTVKAGKDGTVFTIDASAATIQRNDASVSITALRVGDLVAVQGAVNDSSVIATNIIAVTPRSNWQPMVQKISGAIGVVIAIDGSTITIKSKDGTTYDVISTSAKIWKNSHTAATISDIKIGDSIIAQGTIHDTTVTATNILDVKLPAVSQGGDNGKHLGFFARIGSFLKHIFVRGSASVQN